MPAPSAKREALNLDLIAPAGRMLFAIEGMWCGSCAGALEAALRRVPGVTQAGVHFASTSALIRWDPARCDLHAVDRCVNGLGYRLGSPLAPDEVERRLQRETRGVAIRIVIVVFFGMWSMGLALALYSGGDLAAGQAWWLAFASGLLAAPALFAGGPLYRAGWRTARVGVPGIDSLVALGVLGSTALSIWHLLRGSSLVYFDTAAMLVALLLTGRLIELSARRRALIAIRALEGVIPEQARRLGDGGDTELVPADTLALGDRILVDAGSVCPADGIVIEGLSAADRSALTGESRHLPLHPGDPIEAGTVNLSRRVVVEVGRLYGDREIDRIGGHVAAAIGSRGETQRLADRLARLLSVVLPGLAFAVAMVLLFAGATADDALIRGLTVLVVACPCALGIATPVAFAAAVARGARQGLLIRDPAAFERLAGVRTAIFDKTGTLTQGQPVVVSIEPAKDWDRQSVLAAAAKAESGIDHPIARAILAASGGTGGGGGGERQGRRATALADDGRELLVEAAPANSDDAATCLRVVIGGEAMGTIRLIDMPRNDAGAAVRALRARGLSIRLATGDAAGPAHMLAQQVGIRTEEVSAQCTPEGKLDIVRAARRPVLFVGDGINDGPALAEADCGMAIDGAHAGATALGAVVIARGGAAAVVGALDLARRTDRIMRENLAFSILYNGVAVIFAASGAISPIAAALAMLASSLSVSANALRLLR